MCFKDIWLTNYLFFKEYIYIPKTTTTTNNIFFNFCLDITFKRIRFRILNNMKKNLYRICKKILLNYLLSNKINLSMEKKRNII